MQDDIRKAWLDPVFRCRSAILVHVVLEKQK